MSAWFEALGGLFIVLGVRSIWRDSRILVAAPYRQRELSRAKRVARRKATSSLRYGLFNIVIGVLWITGWDNPIVAWVLGGCVLLLLTYDFRAWSRSHRRRKSGGQPA
jgi:hypothetical protein